jgi:ectoine hydroxylase-related dioxygenase (phytanoyl-CoA dioxygenase family)
MIAASSAPPVDSAAFARDGFLHLGRVLDDRALEEIRADEARLRGGQDFDANARARTLFFHNVSWSCPATRAFAQNGPHLDVVERLLGPDLLLWWTQFVTKMPDGDSDTTVFPWHQDCGYLDLTPTPVTAWVALDDVDERNGCVWVVPGSHRDGLRKHARPSDDVWHLTVPVEGDGVAVPLRAGEAVLFTGYTLHRSLKNRTDRPRRAFFCEYATADAREAPSLKPCLPDRDVTLVRGRRA